MSSLSDAVKQMEDYLKEKSVDVSNSVATVDLKSKETPSGQASNTIQSQSIAQVKSSLATNPIVQAGVDTLAQIGIQLSQKLVKDVMKKNDLSPIQNATQNFFQAWATVTTFDTEVAMELARNTARNITNLLKEKQKLIEGIQSEITALHNACAIILNSANFISSYIESLIKAYSYTKKAQAQFERVSANLKSGPRFLTKEFKSGQKNLDLAQALILPDNSADISSIRGITDFASTVINRPSNKQAVAAALAIPGITLNLGVKVLEYVKKTVEINLLVTTFSDALDGWISSFQKSDSVYAATKAHIDAGLKQLQNLNSEMNYVLTPGSFVTQCIAGDNTLVVVNPPPPIDMFTVGDAVIYKGEIRRITAVIGRASYQVEKLSANPEFNEVLLIQIRGSYDPSVPEYGAKISASAIAWGVKLQGIIEWMKMYPGKGAESIDKTANSVAAYLSAKEKLESYTSIRNVSIDQSHEDVENGVKYVTKLMLKVNKILAKTQTSTELTPDFQVVRKYFSDSQAHANRMISALAPFLATSNTLPGPARKVLNQALGIANKYGLDRVVGLINDGKVRELFGVTPNTSTYIGSSITGMNKIIELVKKQPTATEVQISKIESSRDVLVADQTAKNIEANRSYASNSDAAQEEIQAGLDKIKATLQSGISAAKQIDSTDGESVETRSENKIASVIPGFNNNRTAAGL